MNENLHKVGGKMLKYKGCLCYPRKYYCSKECAHKSYISGKHDGCFQCVGCGITKDQLIKKGGRKMRRVPGTSVRVCSRACLKQYLKEYAPRT